MDFKEMDEMWHRIREKSAAEDAGLLIEERVKRINERGRELADRLGLKVVTETSRARRKTGG